MTGRPGPVGPARPDHEFCASANPRQQDTCVRCGRGRGQHPAPADRPRDLAGEQRIAELVALATTDRGLAGFAQQRADPGPVRDRACRDWVREAEEEAADAWWYLVQDALALEGAGESDAWVASVQALVKLGEFWAALQQRRALGP